MVDVVVGNVDEVQVLVVAELVVDVDVHVEQLDVVDAVVEDVGEVDVRLLVELVVDVDVLGVVRLKLTLQTKL